MLTANEFQTLGAEIKPKSTIQMLIVHYAGGIL